ncbi:FAD-dependent oxidoreductase [Alsobacter soli]|uniref:FAD-dependent oxidoreductase n=1 Tax=Alsobacter soli TaxID=2109933 RepID=A0A2T1HR82_9HYPH|nr:FAD-binding oxidoreductase [Alsobacter soli]PSC04153.1 FAD-dependent oxidoreductase [Alsobacter soli]
MSEKLAVDACVVGGGIAGCAAAVALRKAGMTVAVLDRGACGAGASGVNFGGVRQQGRNLHELPLARRSRRIWDTLAATLEQDLEFDVSGHIKLARSEADMAELEQYARDAREYGLELQMLGANRVRSEIPWLGDKVVGASLSPEDGQANPRVVGPAFARLARRLGAEVREHRRVTAARRTERGFAVEAGDLTVESAWLVNSAGVFGGTLASWFGEHAPVEPLMPNMLVTEPLPYFVSRSIGVCGGDVYLRQTGRGNVIFGGGRGWGDAEIARSRPLTDQSLGGMQRTLDLVPALTSAQVIRSWTGIDGQTPDRIPVIGHSSTTPQLVHAFGFSGHGFQLGPVMGEIIAELVTQGRTPTPIEPFAIERFAAEGFAAQTAELTHTEH